MNALLRLMLLVAAWGELALGCKAYSFQTFTVGQVLTAAQVSQIEVNVRDHAHGSSSVSNIGLSGVGIDVCEFRLSLTSGTPVTTADVTGATTLYCIPYKGNRIALFDGTNWNVRNSGEFSLALGTLTSDLPYDVFCYDNAGVPTLEFLAWTNATTRATALTTQNGVLVKTGATTRRYLGTFYTTSTTQTEDSFANRYLWNYYNRVLRPMKVVEATDSWTYQTATWRQANAAAGNQVNYVAGVSEDVVQATVKSIALHSANAFVATGVGVDSTSVNSAQVIGGGVVNTTQISFTGEYKGFPGVGKHSLVWLEISQATGTTTWYGDDNLAYWQAGLVASVEG